MKCIRDQQARRKGPVSSFEDTASSKKMVDISQMRGLFAKHKNKYCDVWAAAFFYPFISPQGQHAKA